MLRLPGEQEKRRARNHLNVVDILRRKCKILETDAPRRCARMTFCGGAPGNRTQRRPLPIPR
jgi:hypothetical protein